jgi:hypothetical protein
MLPGLFDGGASEGGRRSSGRREGTTNVDGPAAGRAEGVRSQECVISVNSLGTDERVDDDVECRGLFAWKVRR